MKALREGTYRWAAAAARGDDDNVRLDLDAQPCLKVVELLRVDVDRARHVAPPKAVPSGREGAGKREGKGTGVSAAR